MKRLLEERRKLIYHQAMVEELIIEDDEIKGVITQVGAILPCENSDCNNWNIFAR